MKTATRGRRFHEGNAAPRVRRLPRSSANQETDMMFSDDPATTIDDQAPRLMIAEHLCGNKVINRQDDVLGEIEEIVLDVPRGRVAYAAMASGGWLGLGERLFAVPWAALRYDAGRQCFVMDASKEVFDNAPGFDKDHWPTQPQPEWLDRMYRHYGVAPYWS
jgi:sporulation protein YlmC with PRC-barrel domain